MLSLFAALMYSSSVFSLCPVKISKKEYLYLYAAIVLSGLFIDPLIHPLASVPVLLLFIYVLIYRKTKNVIMGVFISVLSYVMGIFSEFIIGSITFLLYINIKSLIIGISIQFFTASTYDIHLMDRFFMEHIAIWFVYWTIVAVFPYFLCKPIGSFFKNKANLTKQKTTSRAWILMLIILIAIFLWYYIWMIAAEITGTKSQALYSMIRIIPFIFVAFVIVSFYLFNIIEKDEKLRSQQELLFQLQQYTESIERLYGSIKQFRHDYVNVLSTMSIFMMEKKYTELEEYFTDKILPTQTKISDDVYKLSLLGNIKISALKGIVASKAIIAQENDINFIIDIEEEVTSLNMDIVNLSKIIGILLDNAIEESNFCDMPVINFCIVIKEEVKIIIISNKCRDDIPCIDDMYRTGFSTKGKDRGIGLATVKSIIDKNHNCLLDTKVQDNKFTISIDLYD